MTDDLKKMVDQAVDLGKVREQLDGVAEQAAADRAIAEQRQREYDRTRAWHRAMRRAFKGIYPTACASRTSRATRGSTAMSLTCSSSTTA